MKAAFLQYNPLYLQVETNLDRVASLLHHVEADLIVLPELFASGYFFTSKDDLLQVAEAVPQGPTTERLAVWDKATGAVSTSFIRKNRTSARSISIRVRRGIVKSQRSTIFLGTGVPTSTWPRRYARLCKPLLQKKSWMRATGSGCVSGSKVFPVIDSYSSM